MSDTRRLEGSSGLSEFAQALISEASYLCDLIRAHTVDLHQASSTIGAICGKLPIAVVTARSCVGLGVGVAFDGDFIGQFAQFLCERNQQIASIGVKFGTTAVEEGLRKRIPSTRYADLHL